MAFDFAGSVFAEEASAQEDKVSSAFVEVEEDEHLAAFSLLEDLVFLAAEVCLVSLAEAEVIHFLTKALH